MLKFIKHHMTSIGNIEVYPMISFILFFVFFIVVLIMVIRSSKAFITKMEHLPLEDGTGTTVHAKTKTI